MNSGFYESIISFIYVHFYFIRLLNICLHVIDNVTPGAHSAKVSSLKNHVVLQFLQAK